MTQVNFRIKENVKKQLGTIICQLYLCLSAKTIVPIDSKYAENT